MDIEPASPGLADFCAVDRVYFFFKSQNVLRDLVREQCSFRSWEMKMFPFGMYCSEKCRGTKGGGSFGNRFFIVYIVKMPNGNTGCPKGEVLGEYTVPNGNIVCRNERLF